jgi:transcriptional regulator with XRE-family HTH domain
LTPRRKSGKRGRVLTTGERIRQKREARPGLSQQSLASAIGLSLSQVSKWERDDDEPRASNLRRLAKYFDCTIDELVGDDNHEP